MDILIKKDQDGVTVLQYIKRNLSISAAHLKRLKFSVDGIRVNGEHVTVRRVLREGDLLSLATEDREEDCNVEPIDLPLRIVYEDGDCIVPSKPHDMPTHPSHDHYDDTVANALAYRYAQLSQPFVFRPVNRLDRNTSGLLLVARNRISAGRLSRCMAEGDIRKVYIAVLSGRLPQSQGSIETYMRRTAQSIIVRENCGADEGGDYALTEYRVLCECGEYSLVAASPITGRTHQLRVHFAGMGAPILGDDMYGESSSLIDRHALHSMLLSFPDGKGGKVTVRDKLPEDMERVILQLFDGNAELHDLQDECEKLLFERDLKC